MRRTARPQHSRNLRGCRVAFIVSGCLGQEGSSTVNAARQLEVVWVETTGQFLEGEPPGYSVVSSHRDADANGHALEYEFVRDPGGSDTRSAVDRQSASDAKSFEGRVQGELVDARAESSRATGWPTRSMPTPRSHRTRTTRAMIRVLIGPARSRDRTPARCRRTSGSSHGPSQLLAAVPIAHDCLGNGSGTARSEPHTKRLTYIVARLGANAPTSAAAA